MARIGPARLEPASWPGLLIEADDEEGAGGRPAGRRLVSLLCGGSSGEAVDDATQWLASVAAELEGRPAGLLH